MGSIDGMPAPKAINALIFLDEVNEFNGPLVLIPGSHQESKVDFVTEDTHSSDNDDRNQSWAQRFTSLKYSTKKDTLKRLAAKYGLEAAKGAAGSVFEQIEAPSFIYQYIQGKINTSKKQPHNIFWTDELAKKVYQKYQADFEAFRYDRYSYRN